MAESITKVLLSIFNETSPVVGFLVSGCKKLYFAVSCPLTFKPIVASSTFTAIVDAAVVVDVVTSIPSPPLTGPYFAESLLSFNSKVFLS